MVQYADVVFLVLQDAFVLCRVTKRSDWALENDNEAGDRNPHHQQQIDASISVVKPEHAATSVVNPEDAATSVVNPEDAATSVVKPEDAAASVICAGESNGVAMASITADKESPNGSNELDEWLEELLDPSPSFNPLPDTGCAILPLSEQYAESSVSLTLAVALGFLGKLHRLSLNFPPGFIHVPILVKYLGP